MRLTKKPKVFAFRKRKGKLPRPHRPAVRLSFYCEIQRKGNPDNAASFSCQQP